MRFFASFFAALILAGALPSFADEAIKPPGGLYPPLDGRRVDSASRRYAGKVLSLEKANSTTDRFSFGFQSEWVTVCLQGGVAAGYEVYIRFEFDASTDNWADRKATQSSYFINGVAGIAGLGTQAMVMTGGGDGTDVKCLSTHVRARGVTIHNTTSSNSTLDVTAQ